MGKKKKVKSPDELERDEVLAAYKDTLKGVTVDLSNWSANKIRTALGCVASHTLKAPSATTVQFYSDLFERSSSVVKEEGPLQLTHAVKIKNVVLLEKMLEYWDPLARKCLALTTAVQNQNLRAVQILLPLSDTPTVAVYCLQVSASLGNKQLFDIFEPYMDWVADDCYTARFCALRCADTVIEEERRSAEKGQVLCLEKTRLPNQYEMLVQIIRKIDYQELERRLYKLSQSTINSTVSERGEKGLEIYQRAYEESVLKERLLTAVSGQQTTVRRSKM